MTHTHHRVRNILVLSAGVIGAIIYTVWADTRNQHIAHPPIAYPKWASTPENGNWMVEEAHTP